MVKKFFIVFISLFLSLSANAGMIVRGGAGGGGCNLGYATIGGTSGRTYTYAEVLNVFTASCTGTLQTAYSYHSQALAETAKICVYLDNGDNIPGSADTKVACSGVISSSTVGWASASFSGGSITQGNAYWVVLAGGAAANGWYAVYDTDTLSDYGRSGGENVYTNEPATLPTYALGPDRLYTAYATVQ